MIVATNASSNDALSLVFIVVIITCNFYVFKHFFRSIRLIRPPARDSFYFSVSLFSVPYFLPLFLTLLSYSSSPLLLPPLFLAHTHCPLHAYTAGAIYALRPS